MSEDNLLDDFSSRDRAPSQKESTAGTVPEPLNSLAEDISVSQPEDKSQLMGVWEGISRAGLAETTLRLGTHVLLIAMILFVAWGMRAIYVHAQVSTPQREKQAAFAAALPTATPTDIPPELPLFEPELTYDLGIPRLVSMHTDVPSRPRTEVMTYTVETGDTLFGIAEKFGLKPETLLWGNQFVLGDNPHNLRPGQVLNILPVNGAYHKWSEGDGLNGVAKFFNVTPEDIINWPGNHLSPETIGDYSHPNIKAGTYLIIPGGKREFVSWSAPAIPRDNPSVAKVLGPGVCGSTVNGAVGAGVFVWPADHHSLSGFDYNPSANHPAVDIDGDLGNPVYAADNGVVVYAGWNNWGYGNVIVINHGNGWQTLYAHLSAYNVGCGQSVYQGTPIGAVGSTGNSTGPHLHFEMMYNGGKVNPHDYLP